MNRQMPDLTAALASGRRRAGAGGRAGPATAGPGGMSAVSAARPAWVRVASAWPVRASSSSLVSRPCTNAFFSVSITCSRSAWLALSRSRPAAAGSCGPVVTGSSPARTMRASVARLLPGGHARPESLPPGNALCAAVLASLLAFTDGRRPAGLASTTGALARRGPGRQGAERARCRGILNGRCAGLGLADPGGRSARRAAVPGGRRGRSQVHPGFDGQPAGSVGGRIVGVALSPGTKGTSRGAATTQDRDTRET